MSFYGTVYSIAAGKDRGRAMNNGVKGDVRGYLSTESSY